jgi:hypothetical protein
VAIPHRPPLPTPCLRRKNPASPQVLLQEFWGVGGAMAYRRTPQASRLGFEAQGCVPSGKLLRQPREGLEDTVNAAPHTQQQACTRSYWRIGGSKQGNPSPPPQTQTHTLTSQ